MTTEEQKSIIGGMVLDYAQVRQQLAALELDIQNTLSHVRQAEEVLRFKSLGDHRSEEEIDRYLKDWPTAERLRELLKSLKKQRERKAELEQTMKEYGIQL